MSAPSPDQVLRGPFSIEVHKATFTHYLEVVITAAGRVCYATPSHQQWLASYYRKLTGRDPAADCPRERWADYLRWLMERTGCVCVWTGGVLGEPNDEQARAIETLRREGLIEDRVVA